MTQGFVYIIESPSDTDLLDGRTEGRSLCEALKLAEIPHWYSLAATRRAFEESLNSRLKDIVLHFKQPPILHLSMHGSNEGIALTNGEFLTWADLKAILTPLMNEMGGGLLICMSSCFGSSGCRMAMHESTDKPFWALVGNTQPALWSDAAIAYMTFYHSFFKGLSVTECVGKMKIASGDSNFISYSGQLVQADWASFIKSKSLLNYDKL